MDSAHCAAENSLNKCLKMLANKSKLTHHNGEHTSEKPFECEVCLKKFRQKNHLVRHVKVHTTPFQCVICEKKFAFSSSLIKHRRMHTELRSGKKTFQCKICEKTFTFKNNLVKHHKLHTGEKPFQCRFCHETFTFKHYLLKHIKLHIKKNPFKCNFCQQQIISESDLTRCIEERIGKNPFPPFQCDSCREEFRLKVEVTNEAAVKDGSSGYHSETQMETWVKNEFGDGGETKVKLEMNLRPTKFAAVYDPSGHVHPCDVDGIEKKVKVEDVQDTFSSTYSTFDNVCKSDCKIEVVPHDLELHSDISEHIVKLEKNTEEDGDI